MTMLVLPSFKLLYAGVWEGCMALPVMPSPHMHTLSFKHMQQCTFSSTSFFCAHLLFVCWSPPCMHTRVPVGVHLPLCSAHEAGNLGLDIAQAERTRGGMHRPFPPQLHVNGGCRQGSEGNQGVEMACGPLLPCLHERSQGLLQTLSNSSRIKPEAFWITDS